MIRFGILNINIVLSNRCWIAWSSVEDDEDLVTDAVVVAAAWNDNEDGTTSRTLSISSPFRPFSSGFELLLMTTFPPIP